MSITEIERLWGETTDDYVFDLCNLLLDAHQRAYSFNFDEIACKDIDQYEAELNQHNSVNKNVSSEPELKPTGSCESDNEVFDFKPKGEPRKMIDIIDGAPDIDMRNALTEEIFALLRNFRGNFRIFGNTTTILKPAGLGPIPAIGSWNIGRLTVSKEWSKNLRSNQFPKPTNAEVLTPVEVPVVRLFSVGCADASLLSLPGNEHFLIDGGYASSVRTWWPTVAPLLTLRAIFVTHCDRDHIGGILALAKNFKTLNKWFKVRNLIFTTPEDNDSRKFTLRSIHELKDLTSVKSFTRNCLRVSFLFASGRKSENESRNSMSIFFIE